MATKAATQEVFVWEGSDKTGNRIKGETPGNNIAFVKADLRRQGIRPIKVRKKPKPLLSTQKKVTSQDITVFSRQLATMMTAGVPLVQAFEVIARGHSKPKMQELLLNIKTEIEGGSTLAESLRQHPLHFDTLTCNLIQAGEHAGILEGVLQKIAAYKERIEEIKSRIKKAMFYPVAVLVVAFVITAILMIFVIPQFESLFQSFGADLPGPTRLVIDLSKFFQDYWWLIFGVAIAAVVAFIQARKRSPRFGEFLDKVVLKLPIFGPIMEKAAIARFARTLSTMFAAGVPLVEAMDSVAGATGNIVYSKAVKRMRDEVSTGQQLQLSMRQTQLFPNMVVQMVAIGEESGSLDSMLSKVADFYEAEVRDAVDALSSLMEPIIIVIIGGLIGGMVVAMYLPIFKLGAVV